MGGRSAAHQPTGRGPFRAIADASALIGLDNIGLLETLRPLFLELLVSPALAREIAPILVMPDWIEQRSLHQPIDARVAEDGLGAGEAEVISPGLEPATHVVVVDERKGRRMAAAVGLPLTGAVGLLLAARRSGLIDSPAEAIDALQGAGFHVSPALRDGALEQAGERAG